MKKSSIGLLVVMGILSTIGWAHFQMIVPSESFFDDGRAATISLELIFTHPGGASHGADDDPLTMNMSKPDRFFVVNRGNRIDLTDQLLEYTFEHGSRKAQAWRMDYRIRGMGDFVFALSPAPYYEEREDIYITQHSKVILNSMGFPSDWNEPVGAEAEILPLTWPFNLYPGSLFTGRVLFQGEPVAGAEIEVEYLNIEAFKGAFAGHYGRSFPGGESPAMLVVSDENGYFHFSFPWAGWWGFVALMEGEEIDGVEHEVGGAFFVRVDNLP